MENNASESYHDGGGVDNLRHIVRSLARFEFPQRNNYNEWLTMAYSFQACVIRHHQKRCQRTETIAHC
ncbi:hypothetical protein [Sodalis sp.]|uniref:hypothetical protein n=1 Tax=Sodalis sp. (in: enterobacteria) TaxID=1898979 RepID=UPI0038736AF0